MYNSDIDHIEAFIRKSKNLYRQNAWNLKQKDEAVLFSENQRLKNLHKGKRCFVIANGPSIKKQDLTLLQDEYVFTVNRMVTHPDFKKIKTSFHVWSDMGYFSDELFQDGDMIDILNATNMEDNHPICFYPIQVKDILEHYHMIDGFDVAFFRQGQDIYEGFHSKIDLTKLFVSTESVAIVAIALAVYMGFDEINLLGCDCTNVKGYIDSYHQESVSEYGFDVSADQARLLAKNVIYRSDSEDVFRGCYYLLKEFRWIYEYCERRGIKVFNCTEGGILDSIPCRSLIEALKA